MPEAVLCPGTCRRERGAVAGRECPVIAAPNLSVIRSATHRRDSMKFGGEVEVHHVVGVESAFICYRDAVRRSPVAGSRSIAFRFAPGPVRTV